ncbi:MAG: heme NO-binding domain-containing protein [Bdellovibrionales bacterium]|nr:heme NO-binding domain-containing protein [Bdellovibrionales bacterium]
MKGEIFNLFECFISESFGDETFESILDSAQPELSTQEPFIGPGTYPDQDFFSIVKAAINHTGLPLEKAAFLFGKYCFPHLGRKIPGYLNQFSHPKDFLLTLDKVIHVEVRKVFKNAEPPEFSYEDPGPNELIMIYRSKRKLYAFAEGLIQGVAEHFQTSITIQRTIIDMEEGQCIFHLKFGTSNEEDGV